MEDSPCGLLIKLEKDLLGHRHEGKNYVMGYFDRLTIRPVDRWLSFSPKNTAPVANEAPEPVPSVSAYPIKLIFPEKEVAGQLEESGWDFSCWKQASGPANELFRDNPFLTVVLVNLTDAFKGNIPRDVCGEQLVQLCRIIENGRLADDDRAEVFDRETIRDAHACILPSLGYSDYCLLFAEKSWHIGLAMMEYLHRALHDGRPVLSTDYIIPAYHAEHCQTSSAGGSWDGMELSVRSNLRPGVSIQKLHDAVGGDIRVSQISGSADFLLSTKTRDDFDRLLEMLTPKKAQADDPLRDLVMDTESLLRRPFRSQKVNIEGPKPMERPRLLKTALGELRDVLRDYRELLRQEKRHMRQLSALYERVVAIENICGEFHNRSLQEIMQQWLPAFTDCLSRCIVELRALSGISADKNAQRKKKELWADTENAIEFFNNWVGSFMADLSRSDCFFMESERYNHTSVGSATALLIAYNRWQNSLARAVMSETKGDKSEYAFLVRSGGCDRTDTMNLFWFLTPKTENGFLLERLPLIIQMSEMSLFDCGGTVFRMTHECMHYCGERKREARADYLIRFVGRYYARILTKVLFNQEAYLGTLKNRLRGFSLDDVGLWEELDRCWKDCSDVMTKQIFKIIEKKLTEAYLMERAKWDEPDYIAKNFCGWMIRSLSELFSCYDTRGRFNPFASTLYEGQLRTAEKFYRQGDSIIRKYDASLNFCALESRRLGLYLAPSDPIRDVDLERWIPRVLGKLLPEWGEHAEKDAQLRELHLSGVRNVLEAVLFDCFSEAFADMEACVRLEAPLEDYLLGFVFEAWDPDVVLPISGPFPYRISAVLRTCFGAYLDGAALTEEAREQLRRAVSNLISHGMQEDRIDADALADRVDALLREAEKYAPERKELEDYLTLCKKSYEAEAHPEMKPFQDAFRRIRLLADRGNGDSVTKMFTALSALGGQGHETAEL